MGLKLLPLPSTASLLFSLFPLVGQRITYLPEGQKLNPGNTPSPAMEGSRVRNQQTWHPGLARSGEIKNRGSLLATTQAMPPG